MSGFAYLPRRSRLEPIPFFFALPSPFLERERAVPLAPRLREGLEPREPLLDGCPRRPRRGNTGYTTGGWMDGRSGRGRGEQTPRAMDVHAQWSERKNKCSASGKHGTVFIYRGGWKGGRITFTELKGLQGGSTLTSSPPATIRVSTGRNMISLCFNSREKPNQETVLFLWWRRRVFLGGVALHSLNCAGRRT